FADTQGVPRYSWPAAGAYPFSAGSANRSMRFSVRRTAPPPGRLFESWKDRLWSCDESAFSQLGGEFGLACGREGGRFVGEGGAGGDQRGEYDVQLFARGVITSLLAPCEFPWFRRLDEAVSRRDDRPDGVGGGPEVESCQGMVDGGGQRSAALDEFCAGLE